MADLSAGRASLPPRGSIPAPERHGTLFSMSAFLPSSGVLAHQACESVPARTRVASAEPAAVRIAVM
jgi:hypothetical protein